MVNVIRGLVRPIVTFAFAATCVVLAVWEFYVTGVTPVWFIAQAAMAFGFWFESRRNNA